MQILSEVRQNSTGNESTDEFTPWQAPYTPQLLVFRSILHSKYQAKHILFIPKFRIEQSTICSQRNQF